MHSLFVALLCVICLIVLVLFVVFSLSVLNLLRELNTSIFLNFFLLYDVPSLLTFSSLYYLCAFFANFVL